MKPGTHPEYGPVFRDSSTGTGRMFDTAGKVEMFHRRYGQRRGPGSGR